MYESHQLNVPQNSWKALHPSGSVLSFGRKYRPQKSFQHLKDHYHKDSIKSLQKILKLIQNYISVKFLLMNQKSLMNFNKEVLYLRWTEHHKVPNLER